MKRKKKFLALVLAAVILLSSITIALAVTTADNVKAEGFEVPDQALLQALIDNGADANGDGTITVAEMEGLTWLSSDWYEDCGRKPIKNLSGIEVAKNLRSLSLENNVIEDITPLKSLKELEWVYLGGNPITTDACKDLQASIVRPLILMEGQQFSFVNYQAFTVDIYGVENVTSSVTSVAGGDSSVWAIENHKFNEDLSLWIGTAQKAGNTTIQVKMENGAVLSVPVQVISTPIALTDMSDNIPVLSTFGQLTWTDQYGQPSEKGSDPWVKWGQGATALYPSGELYYIGNHGEVMLAENVRDYVAVNTYGYVGNSVYWNQFNILDSGNTLWKWAWQEEADQPQVTKIADQITDFSAGTALDINGNLLDIRSETTMPIVMTDVAQIDDVDYVLKNDGTVWQNVYGTVWSSVYGSPRSYQFTQLDQDVKHLIGDGAYIKEDGATYVNGVKIADFSAVSVKTTVLNGDIGFPTDYYVAVQEDGSVWKIRMEDKECTKVAEHFSHWSNEWSYDYTVGTAGFYTEDGTYYSLDPNKNPLERSESYLRSDKTLWCTTSGYYGVDDENFKILTSVEDYANVGSGFYRPYFDSRWGDDEFLAVRSDGSIWGYRFNADSKYVPVMVKAPIDKDPAPAFTLGDVNLDGKVNTSDARLALRGAATLETLTDQQVLAADVNKNGKVDTSDARKILRVAAKLDQF